MNTELFFEALEEIDETLLAETEQFAPGSHRAFAKRGRMLWRRIAAVAACLCLLCAGGAMAAQAITGVPILQFFHGETREDRPGVTYDGWTVTVSADPISPQEFSARVRSPWEDAQKIQDGYRGQKVFDDWQEAEDYIGYELMNNPVLERAKPLTAYHIDKEDGDEVPALCLLGCSWREALTGISMNTAYEIQRKPEREPIRIYITATLRVGEESEVGSMGFSIYEGAGTSFSVQEYVTPAGMEVVIVRSEGGAVNTAYESATDYDVFFSRNGAAFYLMVESDESDAEYVLSVLQEILDGFQS